MHRPIDPDDEMLDLSSCNSLLRRSSPQGHTGPRAPVFCCARICLKIGMKSPIWVDSMMEQNRLETTIGVMPRRAMFMGMLLPAKNMSARSACSAAEEG